MLPSVHILVWWKLLWGLLHIMSEPASVPLCTCTGVPVSMLRRVHLINSTWPLCAAHMVHMRALLSLLIELGGAPERQVGEGLAQLTDTIVNLGARCESHLVEALTSR